MTAAREHAGMAELVARARGGDADAWTALVREFEDVAVGLAFGYVRDAEDARDVAQDALLLAFEHLDELAEPAAFPGWLARLVRTAAGRRGRRPAAPRPAVGSGAVADPGDIVVDGAEAARVRAAIEALPDHERPVIALHYLAGLTYPAIGEFLGISAGAAKKRAFSARRRLPGLLGSTADVLAGVRAPRVSATVALFLAIRRRDHATVRGLLAADPGLLDATEQWTPREAMALGLENAEAGTPLVRAVQTGDGDMVRLLLAQGAPASQACRCAGGESALWAAVQLGHREIVEILLAAGADPDAAAFGGVTPLILAAQRGDERMVARLRAAGADAGARDDAGRTAAYWLARPARRRTAGGGDGFVATGVRALDLFAPIRRGSLQYWPPAWEVGSGALQHEIVRSLAPDRFWQIGFSTGPYDATSADAMLRRLGLTAEVRLAPAGLDPAAAHAHLDGSLGRLADEAGTKVVLLLTAPGHGHDVTLAAARLAGDPQVVTTFVVVPGPDMDGGAAGPPEGYDAQVVFDRWRARLGLWPAIDPRATTARRYPTPRHARLAEAARERLRALQRRDPTLAGVRNGLVRYLAQPFAGWEHVTGKPGESTPLEQTLREVEELLGA